MSHCRDPRPQDQNEVLIGGGSLTIDIAKNWLVVTGHRVQSAEKSGAINSSCPRGQEVREADRTIAIHVGWGRATRPRKPTVQSSRRNQRPRRHPRLRGSRGSLIHVSVVRAKPSTADSTMEPSPISAMMNLMRNDVARNRRSGTACGTSHRWLQASFPAPFPKRPSWLHHWKNTAH